MKILLSVFDYKHTQYGLQPKAQAYILDDTNATLLWPESDTQAKNWGMSVSNKPSHVKYYWTTYGCGYDKVHHIATLVASAVREAHNYDGAIDIIVMRDGYQPSSITIKQEG